MGLAHLNQSTDWTDRLPHRSDLVVEARFSYAKLIQFY